MWRRNPKPTSKPACNLETRNDPMADRKAACERLPFAEGFLKYAPAPRQPAECQRQHKIRWHSMPGCGGERSESMSLCKHSEGISTSTWHVGILWECFIAKKRKGIHSTSFFMWMGVSNDGGLHPIVGSWNIWDQQWDLSSTFHPSAPTFGSFNRSIFDIFGNFLKHWALKKKICPYYLQFSCVLVLSTTMPII